MSVESHFMPLITESCTKIDHIWDNVVHPLNPLGTILSNWRATIHSALCFTQHSVLGLKNIPTWEKLLLLSVHSELTKLAFAFTCANTTKNLSIAIYKVHTLDDV